jgi:hypothetical protein
MMAGDKTISIKNQTFNRMQRVGEPLVDTPNSVIERLLDFYEQHQGGAPPSYPENTPEQTAWDPVLPPSLRHTKVMSAILAGQEVTSPSWNRLVDEIARIGRRRLGSFSELKKQLPANIVEGIKQDQGYRYLSDVNLSVQGQDAQDAWRSVAQLAKTLNIGVEVYFLWRNNPAAAFPGEMGNLTIGGKI